MQTNLVKETVILVAAILAGLAAIAAYQSPLSLQDLVNRYLWQSHARDAGVGKTENSTSNKARNSSSGHSAVSPNLPNATPPRPAQSSSSVISASGPMPSAISIEAPNVAGSPVSQVSGSGSGSGSAFSTEIRQLQVEVRSHIQQGQKGRWTNSGLVLWRTCTKLVRTAPRTGTPYELTSLCRELLADAIQALRTSTSASNAQEVLAVTRELRTERSLLSPADALELDRISQNARSALTPKAERQAPSTTIQPTAP